MGRSNDLTSQAISNKHSCKVPDGTFIYLTENLCFYWLSV